MFECKLKTIKYIRYVTWRKKDIEYFQENKPRITTLMVWIHCRLWKISTKPKKEGYLLKSNQSKAVSYLAFLDSFYLD